MKFERLGISAGGMVVGDFNGRCLAFSFKVIEA